ncbi:Uma2 family endonuclease [Streptomyces sp. NPDC029674]|uniref:Uma2 family endonuclease n=1 Tax=Streptomyces sp. NPDC029674 TaxID=3365297 RepID=UPI00384F741D
MPIVGNDSAGAAGDGGERAQVHQLLQLLHRTPFRGLGYVAQAIDGATIMTAQRQGHRRIAHDIADQLRCKYPGESPTSDRRIDFPGHLNVFVPHVVAIREGKAPAPDGRWRCTDIDVVVEVTCGSTSHYNFGPKLTAYATAQVPLYFIADPTTAKCHLFSHPKDGDYLSRLTVAFGLEVDLTAAAPDLILKTDRFPRD